MKNRLQLVDSLIKGTLSPEEEEVVRQFPNIMKAAEQQKAPIEKKESKGGKK